MTNTQVRRNNDKQTSHFLLISISHEKCWYDALVSTTRLASWEILYAGAADLVAAALPPQPPMDLKILVVNRRALHLPDTDLRYVNHLVSLISPPDLFFFFFYWIVISFYFWFRSGRLLQIRFCSGLTFSISGLFRWRHLPYIVRFFLARFGFVIFFSRKSVWLFRRKILKHRWFLTFLPLSVGGFLVYGSNHWVKRF